MKICYHMLPLYIRVKRRISRKQIVEYQQLRQAVYAYLCKRSDFQKGVDKHLIDLAARLFADWLYIEEILSSSEGRNAMWKYADALAKIHSMLMATLDELRVTPKMRQNIAQDLAENDEVTIRVKKLLEGA